MTYEKETEAKTKNIRDTEAENMRIGRKKQRGWPQTRAYTELQLIMGSSQIWRASGRL